MSIWNSLGQKLNTLWGGEPEPTTEPSSGSLRQEGTSFQSSVYQGSNLRLRKTSERTRTQRRFPARPKKLKEGDLVYSANGNKTMLGCEIASGGEGRVFALARKPEVFIKIYKKSILKEPSDREKARQRIVAMCSVTKLAKNHRFSWPRYPVFNEHSEFIGFGMARVPGGNLHGIGSLVQVREKYPDWNRAQLARIAYNFMSGLNFLHSHRVLVGDLNPGNIQFCSRELKTYFIDCDSYQIQTEDASFASPGFVDLYTAPEILNNTSLNQMRSPESEYFSAAILAFHLLMFGLHPFARRGEGDPVSNMRRGSCPWVEDELTSTPMGSWNGYWYGLPRYVQDQFKRAFAKPRWPQSRPDFGSWKNVLKRYCDEMRRCPRRAEIPVFED